MIFWIKLYFEAQKIGLRNFLDKEIQFLHSIYKVGSNSLISIITVWFPIIYRISRNCMPYNQWILLPICNLVKLLMLENWFQLDPFLTNGSPEIWKKDSHRLMLLKMMSSSYLGPVHVHHPELGNNVPNDDILGFPIFPFTINATTGQ